MKSVTNECVGCTSIGLYCLGISCPNRSVVRFYCDRCEEETKLYYYNGDEICKECLLKEFDVIEGSE